MSLPQSNLNAERWVLPVVENRCSPEQLCLTSGQSEGRKPHEAILRHMKFEINDAVLFVMVLIREDSYIGSLRFSECMCTSNRCGD